MRGVVAAVLVAVATMSSLALSPSAPQDPSVNQPRAVLREFCELDSNGGQLSEAGREKLSTYFSTPVSVPTRAIAIKDYGMSSPRILGNRAEFYVEYLMIAELDLVRPALTEVLEMKERPVFVLVKRSEETRGDSPAWRIEGPPPVPHVTVAAAIEHLRARQQQADPALRDRIESIITRLRKL